MSAVVHVGRRRSWLQAGAPDALAASHQLSADLAGNLAGINPRTDALVAS
jgi:hypothetical protein